MDIELKKNIDLVEKVLSAMNYIGGFECDIYELQQDWYRENECYHICDMPVAEYLARYNMKEIEKYINMFPKIKDCIEGKPVSPDDDDIPPED